jgi:hypothetical protein
MAGTWVGNIEVWVKARYWTGVSGHSYRHVEVLFVVLVSFGGLSSPLFYGIRWSHDSPCCQSQRAFRLGLCCDYLGVEASRLMDKIKKDK